MANARNGKSTTPIGLRVNLDHITGKDSVFVGLGAVDVEKIEHGAKGATALQRAR